MKHPEDDIQRACIMWLEMMRKRGRLEYYAVPNGGKRNAITGAILKTLGVRAGVPDLVVLLPGNAASPPKSVYIELKAPGGSLTPGQRDWRDWLTANGFEWALCKSVDELSTVVMGVINARETWR